MTAPSLLPLPAGVARHRLDVRGGPLAILDARPAGTPRGTVLMVPGFTGSKEDFRFLLTPLAEQGWRVVAIDQRGQYESPGPQDEAAYAVDVLGADVLALVEVLGDGPVHLLGHSFGGLVVRSAALQEPRAVLDLVLMSSGPAGLTGPRTAAMGMLRPVLEQGGLPAVVAAVDAIAATDPRHLLVAADLREFLRARMLAGSAAAMLGMGDALLGEPDRVGELAALGLPMLVLHGEYDDAWLPQLQAQMARRLGAEHHVVAEALHSPAVEQPEATLAALLGFWERSAG